MNLIVLFCFKHCYYSIEILLTHFQLLLTWICIQISNLKGRMFLILWIVFVLHKKINSVLTYVFFCFKRIAGIMDLNDLCRSLTAIISWLCTYTRQIMRIKFGNDRMCAFVYVNAHWNIICNIQESFSFWHFLRKILYLQCHASLDPAHDAVIILLCSDYIFHSSSCRSFYFRCIFVLGTFLSTRHRHLF